MKSRSGENQPSSRESLDRRSFVRIAAVSPLLMQARRCEGLAYEGGLTDIRGLRVGHFNLGKRPTGCTVVLAETGATAGVDVRGSAPGTRETDLLNPINTVDKVNAILLSGGSAFGLDAAGGVVRYLEEKGVGFETRFGKVPIVPAAILFDLGLGDPKIRPDHHAAYRACLEATSGPVKEGNVGAGTGATVGKIAGMAQAMKGGIGSASIRVGEIVVAALAAVNAVGDIIDPANGQIVAGARTSDGRSFLNSIEWIRRATSEPAASPGENTSLVVVATNAAFSKTAMTKVAQMAHDGMARAINPAHTPFDGDTIFALSTGEIQGASLGNVGALAAEVTARAIVRGVLTAASLVNLPAACDFSPPAPSKG